MQTLTFTQKLLRQRNFFNFLIPLFAVFVGLGASPTASAQTIAGSNVALNVRGTAGTFDTQATTPGTGNFTQQNFGPFTIGTDVFTLDNATFRVNESPGFSYDEAALRVRVFEGTLATPSTAGTPAFTNISLTSTGSVGGVRTFVLTTGGRNLLATVTTAGSPGTSYRFDVAFRAIDNTNLTPEGNPRILSSAIQNSTFTAASTPPQVSTATLRKVVVTSGTSAASATTTTYDATTPGPGPGVFDKTDFGVLDASVGLLLLQGGTIEIAEKNGDVFNEAFISYVVTPGNLMTSANAGFTAAQRLPLVLTGFNGTTMTRTFSLSNAARNILALAMTGGAGTSYRLDIAVSADGTAAGGTSISLLGPRQRSVFTVTGTPIFMPTLTGTTVLISPTNAPNVSYDANNVSPSPDFNGANLSTFDITTGQLVLNGGTATTNENGPNTISSVVLYYRVRITGTGGGGFTPLALTQNTVTMNADGSRTRNFSLSNAAQNLLAAVTAVGTYNVDVYLQASGANSATGVNFPINDDNVGNNYVANFTVNGTPIVNTVWTGGLNDNWFDTRNWNNGIPTAIKNAIVPNFASGSNRPYPNIYSNVVKAPTPATVVINPDGSTTPVPADPGYDNTGSGNAQVRNLILQGNSQLDRSITRLIIGRLDVFGNFDNPHGSFIQRDAGIISFKSQGAQTISGSINGFFNVEIDGGVNSIKTLTNSFEIKAGGSLRFINGILQTNIVNTEFNFVDFSGAVTSTTTSPTGPPINVTTPAAQLLGESETTFLRGFLKTTQVALVGVRQNFSNIGLALTFVGNAPGNVFVTRDNGDNYPPSAFGGTNPKPSIRRVFGVQPANANTNTGGLRARLVFSFLDNELVNLRTNNATPADFSGSVDKSRLSLYVSPLGGNSFFQLGRDSNSNNVLVKNEVTSFATFTLSEQRGELPLPVTLTTFEAKRMGADALVTWETASEFNSKGYNVQVSTDGKTFRTVGFVASESSNSVVAKSYSFTDTEKNKVGVRYYRLEQLDLDGKTAFFAPRAVTFEGRATASGVLAYPNPFTNEVRLNLTSATEGNALVRISDMTGRLVGQRQIVLAKGANDVEVTSVSDLKGGLYLLNVTLPNGETKTMKVVKQ